MTTSEIQHRADFSEIRYAQCWEDSRLLTASLLPAGREFQLSGTIEKDVGGVVKRHDFVRADRFSSREEAQSFTLAKGRQIIDEQGEGVFSQSWPHKPN